MTSLAKLQQLADGVTQEYFTLLRSAELVRANEVQACTKIQAAIRGHLLRLHLGKLDHTVVTIQRFWRGYLGRRRFKRHLDNYERRVRKAYFNSKATVIQRHWRGFYSRKYVHNFHARKQFLHDTLQRNAEIRQLLEEEQQAALALQRQLAEEAAKTQFDQSIRKMHHLVSTSHIPGIFNSPYAAASTGVLSKDGIPIDDHLKSSIRAQTKKQRLPPLSAPAQIGTTSSPTSYSKLSLRQSVHYNTVKDASQLEARVNRSQVLKQHGVPFMPVVKQADPFLHQQSLRNCETYVDPWDPTVGNRTERFDPVAQSLSNSLFKKFLQKQEVFQDTLTRPVQR